MTLTGVSGSAATCVRWKGEGSGWDGESEPAEGHPTETRQGSAKASLARKSARGRASRRWFLGEYLFCFFTPFDFRRRYLFHFSFILGFLPASLVFIFIWLLASFLSRHKCLFLFQCYLGCCYLSDGSGRA